MAKAQQTYAQAGVDVNIEAKAARILYEASKKTWANRAGMLGEVIVPFDDFAGLRFVRADKLPPGTVMYGGSDGVATKAEMAERAGRFDMLAFDLMAMVCDDAVIRGGEPVLVKTVLDMNTLGQDDSRLPYIRELAEGYIGAAKEAGVAVINGELAQLNNRMGRLEQFSIEWSADVTWFAHESRLITGKAVQVGHALVGLEETGLRCNGISLIRKLLAAEYGDHWETAAFGDKRLIDVALQPSRIYSAAVVDMFGGYDLKRPAKAKLSAVAHISGGGIPEKLGRVLRASGLGAVIDDPFTPCDLMLHCQELGNVADKEAYGTWNMGQGMILATPEPDAVIQVAQAHGINAKVIGHMTQESGIRLKNKGRWAQKQEWVTF
ncbi:MAG TPA: AIR synthase-related protein [Candidatus Saccharimonadales bacterium]|jgi:phosphoribosylformylglycinamidine cyclo-ligase|nr:AIR synthase-related protein [Candidatus Saccharimonadales bacterium]